MAYVMNMYKLILLEVLIIIFFNNCGSNNEEYTTDIEGLWISTEETSSLFEPGADKVALQIKRDSNKTWSARGFFMKNGEFKADWEFSNVIYEDITKKIFLFDTDSDTLIVSLDAENEILKGAIHTENNINAALNFVHAGKKLEIRLLYPRIPDNNGNITYSYQKPEHIDDGLKTASVYRYSTDSLSFLTLMKEVIDQKYGSIKSLLILKDNKLIVEEYFYGYSREDLQQIRSCTKSITSLLCGITLDHHKDIDLEQSIYNFFPEYDAFRSEGREKITLKNVFNMTAGLEWDDIPSEMFEADDCFQFILSRPLESKPGEKFIYNSGCSILLGGVISYLETIKTQDFAEKSLFTPLGISEYIWETHKDGTLQCGSGLSLRPRDMAKIGLLVLNDGKWQDKQLVTKVWIQESTKPQVQESKFFDYGYQWWHHSKNNLQWWKDPITGSPEEHDMIIALGHGGQYIIIIRDLKLVIVTTASDFENSRMALSKVPMAVEEIIPIFDEDNL